MKYRLPNRGAYSIDRKRLQNFIKKRLLLKMHSDSYHLRSVPFLFIFLLVLLNLLSPSGVIFAQEEEVPRWSEPIPLSSKRPSSWFPDIAVDSNGGVHVVWSSKVELESQDETERAIDAYDVVMYTYSPNGIDWEEPFDLIAIPATIEGVGGYEVTRPSIIFDDEDKLHLVFRRSSVQYSQASLEGIREAANWLEPRQMSSTSGYYSDIAIDGNNVLHLVYTQNVPTADCPICYHVLYRWSDNDGLSWSNVTDVSLLPIGAVKPQILIDDRGIIHIVWEAGRGGGLGQLGKPTDVRYSASHNGGQLWTLPLEFYIPNGQAANVTISQDGDGQLVVVWLDTINNGVFYQLSSDEGDSWSTPEQIPDVIGIDSRLDTYDLIMDRAGNIHLVMVGRRESNQLPLELFHLVWMPYEDVWTEPEVIASFTGDIPEWPRISLGEGDRLHVVWFVRDKAHVFESDRGRYQIWYAQSQPIDPGFLDAPEPTAAAVTESINESSGEVRTPQTATISATEALNLPTDVNPNMVTSESGALSLVVLSLIPVFLFMGLIVVILYVRR